MCEQEPVNATYRGTVKDGDCTINWKSITIRSKPGINFKVVSTNRQANYTIDPEPDKPNENFYKSLANAAASKVSLQSLPTEIINLRLSTSGSGKTYHLKKS